MESSSLADLYRLIRRFEGCRLTPYICPAGTWSCGWGSTGADVFPGRPWTQAYADARMAQDAARFARGVTVLTLWAQEPALNALADFAYNLGLGAYRGSTLRRRALAGDAEGIRRELGRWVRGGGRVLPGLVLRRAAEAALI